MNNKRIERISEMYKDQYYLTDLPTGGVAMFTADNVMVGAYADSATAILCIPVINFNSKRGYVPKELLKTNLFKPRQPNRK